MGPMQKILANKNILNAIWFQLGWWALVLSASYKMELLGFAISLCLIAIHFGFIANNLKKDIFTLICCGGLGVSGDFILIQFEIIQTQNSLSLFPIWLIGLWFLFPITLNYSLAWSLKGHLIKPLVAIGAAGSYFAGKSFEILYLKEPIFESFLVITAVWWIYFLLFEKTIIRLNQRFST